MFAVVVVPTKVQAVDAQHAIQVANENHNGELTDSALVWTATQSDVHDITVLQDPAPSLTDAPAPAPAPAKWGVVQPADESEDSLIPTLTELAIDLGQDAGASPRSALETGLQIQAKQAQISAKKLDEQIEQAEQRVAQLSKLADVTRARQENSLDEQAFVA